MPCPFTCMIISGEKEKKDARQMVPMQQEKSLSSSDAGQRNGDNPSNTEGCGTWKHHIGAQRGLMRKEREWERTLACKLFEERTLACKLFEERRSIYGGEGMDLLWEMHNMNSVNSKLGDINNGKKQGGGDGDEEVAKSDHGRKVMNLGIGRFKVARISKAIEGVGWLGHVINHSKKTHNNRHR